MGGLLLVALAVRAFAWSQTAVIFNDGPVFLAMAEAIADGRFADVLAHPYHPLYPGLIAALAMFSVDFETAAVAVSILGGLLSIAALFWFVRRSFGRDIAWIAAWILALHPWAIDFSSDVMSDGIYAGFFLLAFALMTRVLEVPRLTNSVVMGLVCGLAFLVRPEGAGLLIAGVVLFALRALGNPDLRRRAALACAAAGLAFALAVTPFVAFVSETTGEFTLTQKKSISNLVSGSAQAGSVVDRESARDRLEDLGQRVRLPAQSIRTGGPAAKRPERSPAGALSALGRVVTTSMAAFRWELILLALIGIWASRSDPESRHPGGPISLVLVAYMGLLVLLVWGAGYVSRRHALPPWLPVIGYAALGAKTLWRASVVRVFQKDSAMANRLCESRTLCAAIVVALVLGWGARDFRQRRTDRIPERVAAEWLATQRPDSGAVAAQKLRVAYYAEADFVPLPSGERGRVAENLRRKNARWVVIDRDNLSHHRGLEEGLGDWLRLVHTVPFEERAILVLSIEPRPAR